MSELAELARLAGRATWTDDWLAKNLRNLGAFVEEARLVEEVRGARDHDELESALWRLSRRDSGPGKIGWTWKGSAGTRWGKDLDMTSVHGGAPLGNPGASLVCGARGRCRSRYVRSSRKLPRFTSCRRARCVAATSRTSTAIASFAPTGVTACSSSTRWV
jgi:hypothetical protein